MSDGALRWHLAWCEPDAWQTPSAIEPATRWIDAEVPGTVASALEHASLWSRETGWPLDSKDYWYCTEITGSGPRRLRFDGLATLAEVFLDDRPILTSDNMYLAHEVEIDLSGTHRLHLRFKALAPVLAEKRKRPRWRTRVANPATLRFVRTSLLGYMPGWCPPVPAIGPWRGITVEHARPAVEIDSINTTLDGACGLLDVALRTKPGERLSVSCAGIDRQGRADADGVLSLQLCIEDVALWWPQTHGVPTLHELDVRHSGRSVAQARVGFRTIAVDRGSDGTGFGLTVNGTPVFCRGACWVPPDVTGLTSDRATLRPSLEALRDAGANMVRVSGTMVYESDDFYALCDELGLMVWQDFMFASLDYPADAPGFADSVAAEARHFLTRTKNAPSLAVLCGASETGLQAAMFGLPAATWTNPLFETLLAGICAKMRPDVPYIAQTPFGGPLPFVANEGVSHYYGVSAHMRPLDDARRAEVRFAAECLCFANVPEGAVALDDGAATRQTLFAPPVEGDTNAVWFFEKVRNFYLRALYAADPAALRRDDPARYLDLSRAVSAEIIEHVIGDWRRVGSPTRGALVWFLKDLVPGAGWGLLDSAGTPKAAYFGLKRASRPVTVILADEGLNGLQVHVLNETPTAVRGRLSVACLRDGETVVMRAERDVTLEPRSATSLPATELWGGFFDTTYAYRFGPPSHDVTVARLADEHGGVIADAFHFPLGRTMAPRDLGLRATPVRTPQGWELNVQTDRFAQSVCLDVPGFRPAENWFHLAPGFPRRIGLLDFGAKTPPAGTLRAVNGQTPLPFAASPLARDKFGDPPYEGRRARPNILATA